MVQAGVLDGTGRGAEVGPDIGQQRALADEFRALGAADLGGQAGAEHRLGQCRAFAVGLGRVKA